MKIQKEIKLQFECRSIIEGNSSHTWDMYWEKDVESAIVNYIKDNNLDYSSQVEARQIIECGIYSFDTKISITKEE